MADEVVSVDAIEPHPLKRNQYKGDVNWRLVLQIRQSDQQTEPTLHTPPRVTQDDKIIDGVDRWLAVKKLDWQTITVNRTKVSDKRLNKDILLSNDDFKPFSVRMPLAIKYHKSIAKGLYQEIKSNPQSKFVQKFARQLGVDDVSKLRRQQISGNYMGVSGEYFRKGRRIWEVYQDDAEIAQDYINQLDNREVSIARAYDKLKPYMDIDAVDTGSSGESNGRTIPRRPESAGQFQFLPVMGKQFIANSRSDGSKSPLNLDGSLLTWWDDDSILPQYPWVFLKPLEEGIDADAVSFHDAYRLDNVFTLSDSGGFQIMEGRGRVVSNQSNHSFSERRVHPSKLVDWQVQNADAGIMLDEPPFAGSRGRPNIQDSITFRSQIWEPRKRRTIQNAKVMVSRLNELRNQAVDGATDFYLLPVVQGDKAEVVDDPWELVRDWHQETKAAIGQPNAWALSTKPPNLDNVGVHLTYAISDFDDAVEHVHFLQHAGTRQLLLLEWYSMLTGKFVTSDATTHIAKSNNWKFPVPGSWIQKEELDIGRANGLRPLNRIPCRCPACSTAKQEWGAGYMDNAQGIAYQTRSLHNLHQLLQFNQYMTSLMRWYGVDLVDALRVVDDDAAKVRDGNEFWSTLINRWNENAAIELWKVMRALVLAKEKGLDAVHQEKLLTDKPPAEMMDAMKW